MKSTADDPIVPKSNPPLLIGFVNKSPKVAPKGLVRINADQNKNILLIFVYLFRRIINKIMPPIKIAPPIKPNPESSDKKSPSAVPNVFDTRIALQ